MRSLDLPNPSRRELIAGLAVLTVLAAVTTTRLDRPQQAGATEFFSETSAASTPPMQDGDRVVSNRRQEKDVPTSE